jgi:hypothetical protein
MKKVMIGIVAVLCVVVFVSAAFAEEKEGMWWFKPALSMGYAFGASNPSYSFTTDGLALLGAAKIDLQPPHFSGIDLAAELPFALTDRLTVTLEGGWMMSFSNEDMREVYNNTVFRRSWDIDNNNYGLTADVLVSYALIKSSSFIKDVAIVGGLRWDYLNMSFDDPHNPILVFSTPNDTLDLSTHTLAPVFGLTGTFKGFKYGMFGGDMSLGVLIGPIVWGHVNYEEIFGNTNSLSTDDDFGSGGYLLKVFGEITALSGKITPGMDGSLSVFTRYTRTKTGGRVDMNSYAGGIFLATQTYDFNTVSDVVVVGLKGAIEF